MKQKKPSIKKILVAASLSTAMVLGTIPMPFLNENYVVEATDDVVKVSTAEELNSALAVGGDIKLTAVIETESTINVSKDVNLDLNGYGIWYTGTEKGTVINVSGDNKFVFTIVDSTTNTTERALYLDGSRRCVGVDGTGTITETKLRVTGGFITGGNVFGENEGNGGGVIVGKNAKFIFEGGTICGNFAQYCGAGVYLDRNSTSLNITGGRIYGNTCNGYGGAVYMDDYSTFNMSGGSIDGNIAYQYGGGVYVNWESTLNMSGGAIIQNITNNTAASYCGGGVYAYFGTLNFSGNPVISGNKQVSNAGSIDNNLYCEKPINVTSELLDGTEINILDYQPMVIAQPGENRTVYLTENELSFFKLDSKNTPVLQAGKIVRKGELPDISSIYVAPYDGKFKEFDEISVVFDTSYFLNRNTDYRIAKVTDSEGTGRTMLKEAGKYTVTVAGKGLYDVSGKPLVYL